MWAFSVRLAVAQIVTIGFLLLLGARDVPAVSVLLIFRAGETGG